MRQIDGMKENLTEINGAAGNNHDGEREMKVTISSSTPKHSDKGKQNSK